MMMCLGVGLLGFILFGTLSASWTCMSVTKLGKFSAIIVSNRFSISCSHSSSGTPKMRMLARLKLSQRLLTLSSFLWILFSFCCSDWAFFASLYSKSMVCFLDLRTLLFNLCKLFFISVNVSFISDCASIISDWSFFMLLRPSLSSLRFSLSSLSILISSILNSASVRLLTSISLSSFLGVLFCSFIWDLFLCLLILAASLCLFLCYYLTSGMGLAETRCCSFERI
uniref:Uncharacterized protein n=1 Tax=Molossus molossus TaxID=27622 RepID=A0A7J8CRW1_MOLMO|nr:hypothetical protein HJG59_009807 [Molossus molossus]